MYAHFINRADVIFAIGSSLTRTPFGPALPAGKTIIHATNAASDINKDISAALGLVGDAALVLEALIIEIERQRSTSPQSALADLKHEIAALKQDWRQDWQAQARSNEMPINQYRVIQDLMDTVDRDHVILTHDAGSPREQLLPMWESTQAASYLGWGKSTQLGYGLPLAMGAKLAAPEKLCINFMGDASFGMTGMDIETAARNHIGILTIVFNNAVMACERQVMEISTRKYDAIDIGGDYRKIAEGLNVAALRVENPSQIIPAIKDGIAVTQSGAPFLIEIMAKQGYDFSRYA